MPMEVSQTKSRAEELLAFSSNRSLWSIVLSGGEGTRMRPVIERWLGSFRPKQYCTFVGTRSMLQHTLDRATSVTDPENVVTVIGNGHRVFLDDALGFEQPGMVMEQPMDCGTAAGIFLPLAYVLEHDPKATVLVLPSDHFVYPEAHFIHYASEAVQLAEWLDDKIILLGAEATRPETDYGWIEPGDERTALPLDSGICAMDVGGFREKPCKLEADRYYRRHWLWNTMVFAARAETLWSLGCRLLPDMMAPFRTLRSVLRAVLDERVPADHFSMAVTHLYNNMPTADFSRHILQKSAASTVVMPIKRVHWCDWGRPERVAETLANLGCRPAFQLQNLGTTAEA